MISILIYAQPTKKQIGSGEIKDLKELVSKYCKVKLLFESNNSIADADSVRRYMYADVEAERYSLYFVDKNTGIKIKFHGSTELLNFMYREGWRFIDTIPPENNLSDKFAYLFEKRED